MALSFIGKSETINLRPKLIFSYIFSPPFLTLQPHTRYFLVLSLIFARRPQHTLISPSPLPFLQCIFSVEMLKAPPDEGGGRNVLPSANRSNKSALNK